MPWKRRLPIAASCVAALVVSAGGWVITQHDFDIREQRVTIAVNWIRQGEYNLRAELRERHATDDELPDPLLPPELLPQPWSGTAARAVVAECWAALDATPLPPIRLFRWYAVAVAEITGALT